MCILYTTWRNAQVWSSTACSGSAPPVLRLACERAQGRGVVSPELSRMPTCGGPSACDALCFRRTCEKTVSYAYTAITALASPVVHANALRRVYQEMSIALRFGARERHFP